MGQKDHAPFRNSRSTYFSEPCTGELRRIPLPRTLVYKAGGYLPLPIDVPLGGGFFLPHIALLFLASNKAPLGERAEELRFDGTLWPDTLVQPQARGLRVARSAAHRQASLRGARRLPLLPDLHPNLPPLARAGRLHRRGAHKGGRGGRGGQGRTRA